MITVGWLFLYAGLLGWVGDYVLSRSSWPSSAPRLALWVWHATAAGVLLAVGWAMVLLAHDVMEHGFAWLFQADKSLVHLAYAPEAEVPTYWNATILVLLVGLGVCLLAAWRRTRTERAATESHDVVVSQRLRIVTPQGAAHTVGVCRSSVPLIYCLPGRHVSERIRVTTGALDALGHEEFLAAVEHEQAHIACRHHIQLLLADSAVAALRWSRLLRHYPQAVRDLVEYQADDYAAKQHGPRTVAGALLTMCTAAPGAAPAGASWTGGTPALRIKRLLATGGTRPRMLLRSALVGAALVLPLTPSVAAVAPALSVANTETAPASHHNEAAFTSDFDHHP